MPRLIVFNNVSLDGYYTTSSGLDWAHSPQEDEEWTEFVSSNASGGGRLLFGRKTYEMMQCFWPTPAATEQMPTVAKAMNSMPKVVFSRTLTSATWNNSIIERDLIAGVKRLKADNGSDMCILGSGSLVSPLIDANLIDEMQLVIVPVLLGTGVSMFCTLRQKHNLKLVKSRTFKNGNVVLSYAPA